MAYFYTSKRASRTRTFKFATVLAEALQSGLAWFADAAKARRDIEELSRMSDHELADIGLCRSDLTLYGLSVAGRKRVLQQNIVADEIADLSRKRKATKHGD